MVRLTQLSRGGGCACKMPPGELEQVVAGLHRSAANLLVGLVGGDDAAVAEVDGRALISTVDFFPPVVDDAYDWGRIAAANALSDVYAMGGRPLLALNLLCWPRATLPLELASEVLRGGLDVATSAGCVVGGGHTVDDAEPKYGMSVLGLGNPSRLLRNDAGRPGDPLVLTKALGIGVLCSMHRATAEPIPQAIAAMTLLNADASAAALESGARAATDVTGFGLLGHLMKLARASGVTAEIDSSLVPLLPGARAAADAGHVSGGTRRNLEWVAPHTSFADDVDEVTRLLLADAQTSGGLLVAGDVPGVRIGRLVARREVLIDVR
jgi:selenide,water dikinase